MCDVRLMMSDKNLRLKSDITQPKISSIPTQCSPCLRGESKTGKLFLSRSLGGPLILLQLGLQPPIVATVKAHETNANSRLFARTVAVQRLLWQRRSFRLSRNDGGVLRAFMGPLRGAQIRPETEGIVESGLGIAD